MRVDFGGVRALEDVDLTLDRGQILGLIGPNGAGKTTLVNVLSGFQPVTAGRVCLDGVEVTGWAPHRLARAGLTRTFQNVRLFAGVTAFENVEAAAVAVGMARPAARQLASELLERMGLGDHKDRTASALPYGHERRLAIARALATRPTFLLLDEPAAGLNEGEAAQLVTALKSLRTEFSCGLLVIDHDMRLIMELCECIQVLDHGATIALGTPAEVRADSAVLTAYLGSTASEPHAER